MAEIKIFVTNLGKYNEGELVGKWLELPATDEEIEETLESIGINEVYEEYFITDYESEIDGLKIGEYDSIVELNELSEKLEDVDEEQFAAALYFSSNFDEALDILEDVVYITTPRGFETDEEAVGMYYVYELGCLNIPAELENYIDFEAYGRDIMINGSFYTAESGAIYEVIR